MDWLSFIAVVVTITGIPITILATRTWGTRRAKVQITLDATSIIPIEIDSVPLKVTYEDHLVENPYLITVIIDNKGPRDVSSAMFDADKSLFFWFDQPFYGLTSTAGSTEFASSSAEESQGGGYVQIFPGLLSRGAQWSFSALVSGPAKVRCESSLIDTKTIWANSGSPDTPEPDFMY
ncbi:hypothetical protein [Glycomyces tritici]|uniref:DUF4352 domain-containing protein n=1 Tax=Glycomyces tritici TaxID=2665176 RepID=A0ABT7YPI6_9ACTN|nr:hypothetical protein [Glycomyces tritici]MDN3240530.1 hypothetical protein [Glycomyces tritici]